ncbi:MAG: radical SAM family heme chaperone HemW [Bacteroidetes bacterium]|nr:radical SAM family heme chaperone HemW [Bacteroidota bacterium]
MYLHIPFCRKACSYCDFHFSVNHEKMDAMIEAMCKEIELRKNYLENNGEKTVLQTIYFGGGTPSLLNSHHLDKLFNSITKYFTVAPNAEITLEANPDDLTDKKLLELKQSPINRLSIGVQSFFDDDLILMNRAHNASMATNSVKAAANAGFNNLTIDLIYGIPGMSDDKWKRNLDIAFSLPVEHLSCYSLTVEKKTALDKWIREGKIAKIDDESAINHFKILMSEAAANKFDHYEISNFGRKGFYSNHNSSYWKNKSYLGIGPSAHSYNGISRQWNISGNTAYIMAINKNEIPAEIEILTIENKFNEYIMTGIRTKWGLSRKYILNEFGAKFEAVFIEQINEFIDSSAIQCIDEIYTLTDSGKLIADRIASKLFVVL